MPNTTFLFIRHGAHVLGGGVIAGRSEAASLSAEGRAQAERLAERLAGVPLRALYSSPVRRARETAAPVARRLGLEVQACEPLAEVDFGEWAGRPLDALRAGETWASWGAFRSGTRIPGGERALEVQARVVGEVLRLWERHPESCVGLVSHGDPIKYALAFFLGAPLDLARRIEVGLASVSVVAVGDGGPWVLGINHGERVPLPWAV